MMVVWDVFGEGSKRNGYEVIWKYGIDSLLVCWEGGRSQKCGGRKCSGGFLWIHFRFAIVLRTPSPAVITTPPQKAAAVPLDLFGSHDSEKSFTWRDWIVEDVQWGRLPRGSKPWVMFNKGLAAVWY